MLKRTLRIKVIQTITLLFFCLIAFYANAQNTQQNKLDHLFHKLDSNNINGFSASAELGYEGQPLISKAKLL